MGSRVWAFRLASVLVGVVASAVITAIALALLTVVLMLWMPIHGQSARMKALMEDRNDLRQLVMPVAASGKLPLKDGAFDPYRFVRKGAIRAENPKVLHSRRSGTGPTGEEIERGDYTNFPWERYRGDGKLGGAPFPLLWEKKPDDKGRVLVGLSDGTSEDWDRATLEAALHPR